MSIVYNIVEQWKEIFSVITRTFYQTALNQCLYSSRWSSASLNVVNIVRKEITKILTIGVGIVLFELLQQLHINKYFISKSFTSNWFIYLLLFLFSLNSS